MNLEPILKIFWIFCFIDSFKLLIEIKSKKYKLGIITYFIISSFFLTIIIKNIIC